MFTIPKWVVYDIVLTTLINIINYQRLKLYHIIPLIYVWVDYGFIIYGYIVINLIKPYLIGGFNPSEKYESQWEGLSMIIKYIMENKKCSKPPTRYILPHEQTKRIYGVGRLVQPMQGVGAGDQDFRRPGGLPNAVMFFGNSMGGIWG